MHDLAARSGHLVGRGNGTARPDAAEFGTAPHEGHPRATRVCHRAGMRPPPEQLARWRSEAWRADMAAWLHSVVADAGAEPTAAMVVHRVAFWSALVSIETAHGRLWAKENHPVQAFEGPMTTVLAEVVSDQIVAPAAVSGARMATWDAGPVLTETGEPDADWLTAVVSEFAELQRRVEVHGRRLLTAGLPDFPVSAVPGYVATQLDACQLLPVGHPFHLTRGAADAMEAGLHRARAAVEVLSRVDIPPSIEHNDLYGANCFPDLSGTGGHRLRFFDFGDAVWTHPFGVLAIPLRIAFSIGVTDADTARLVDAYLDAWTDVAPLAELRPLVPAAVRLAGAQRFETYRRQLAGVDPEAFRGWETSALGWLASTTDPQP